MRTVQRTASRALLRDAATLAAAMIAVGASFGAIAIAYGLPVWVPFLMSTVVFAGGAQFLAVGLLAAGNPLAAVLAGLLLNTRHLPFGLAVAEALGPRRRDRIVGSHLMTDEVVAFTLAEVDPAQRRRTYWLIGVTLFTSWNIGTGLGVLLGGVTGDPDTLGLDAAFPAALIALIMPSLRDRATRMVALTGTAVAVLLTPVLPAGLPVMCALLGLVTVVRFPRRRSADPSPAGPSRRGSADPSPSDLSGRHSAGPSADLPGRLSAGPRADSPGRLSGGLGADSPGRHSAGPRAEFPGRHSAGPPAELDRDPSAVGSRGADRSGPNLRGGSGDDLDAGGQESDELEGER